MPVSVLGCAKAKELPQILAIVLASTIAFIGGYIYAWSSPFLIKITQDKENYNISEDEASYFIVAQALSMFLFPPFLVPVINTFGRKRTLQISTIPYIICFLMKAFAKNIWIFYTARFFGGVGDAMVFAALPAYIGEIAIPEVRGVWGNSFAVSMFLGQFFINVVGSYVSVQVASYIGIAVLALFLVTFSFMPKSPYFLVMKGEEDKAKESLRRLRSTQDVESEFNEIKLSVQKHMAESTSWKDIITVKVNRKAFQALFFLRISQLFSGVLVFAAYTQFIFQKSGGNTSAQVSAILYSGLNVVMFLCSSFMSDKLGRRKAFMISTFLSGIIILIEAAYFYIDAAYAEIDLESLSWFPLAGMLIFVVVSSFGIGIIPSLMLGELFSTSIKAKGISLITSAFAAGIIVTNNIFYYLNAYSGLYGPFFLFGVCNLLSTVLTYFILPETKGKTLEEIQHILLNM